MPSNFKHILGIYFTDSNFAYGFERQHALVDEDEQEEKLTFNQFLGK